MKNSPYLDRKLRSEAEAQADRLAKHTPGPWAYRRPSEDVPNVEYWIDGPPEHGATIGKPIADIKRILASEAKANARLIAAAPDLLALTEAIMAVLPTTNRAVKNLMRGDNDKHTQFLRDTHSEALEALITAARAAIAKATGQRED